MSVRECSECWGKVSTYADVCPHCGCPVDKMIPIENMSTPHYDFIYNEESHIWCEVKKYVGHDKHVEIPEGIELLWDNMFAGNADIEELVIANQVEHVRELTICNMPELRELYIGPTVKSVGGIINCPKLHAITVSRAHQAAQIHAAGFFGIIFVASTPPKWVAPLDPNRRCFAVMWNDPYPVVFTPEEHRLAFEWVREPEHQLESCLHKLVQGFDRDGNTFDYWDPTWGCYPSLLKQIVANEEK